MNLTNVLCFGSVLKEQWFIQKENAKTLMIKNLKMGLKDFQIHFFVLLTFLFFKI